MPDDMTTPKAAAELGTTAETIRKMLRDGELSGRQNGRGWWIVDPRSVDDFRNAHGPLNGGRRRKTRAKQVGLAPQSQSKRGAPAGASAAGADSAIRELETLRARVVVLEDSLAAIRDAAELQRRADAERSEVVEKLLAALGSSERADRLRSEAIEKLEDALARTTVPSHPTDS